MDSKLNPEMESQKRRSVRIVQAVPLTVTGVDALGRPFQERTSTLIINCHGCRYQSKHYVLKNMWVTLEIPHNEPGHEPRSVRGRVTWIQRPRTVRELFQIGVELEIPGNVWGIAFPPADWFPFPDFAPQAEIPAAPETSEPAPVATLKPAPEPAKLEKLETHLPSIPEPVLRSDSNVNVVPFPAGPENSPQMARQVARLVADAKQQIQGAVREAAADAMTTEARSLLASLQAQMKEAAEKSVTEAVAGYIQRTQADQKQAIQKDLEASVAAMKAEWAKGLDQKLAEMRLQADSQLADVERSRRAEFEKQIQNQVVLELEKIKNFGGSLDTHAEDVRAKIEQLRQASAESGVSETTRWQDVINQRASEAQLHLSHLEQVAQHLAGQISDVTSQAESRWRQMLEADLSSASTRWSQEMEASLQEASERTADLVARQSEAATRQAATQAEAALGTLRAAISTEAARGQQVLANLQESVNHLEAKRGELDSLHRESLENWSQKSQELLESHGAELNRRAESSIAGMAARLQPVLEASGNETIERLAHELHQKISPEIMRAMETVNQLVDARNGSEEAFAEYQQRLSQASERSAQDSVTRSKGRLTEIEREFEDAARTMASKWFTELESKASETTHTTFEALYKSAEWYEKKVQTQMQSTLERGVDQAASSLRVKAAELSGQFASELDHYSRSFVEHSQTQIQENAKDAADQAATMMAEAREKAAAEFIERSNYLGQQQLETFAAKAEAAFDDSAARMEAHTGGVRRQLENDTRAFAGEYQRALSQHTQQSLVKAKEELAGTAEVAKEALHQESQALDRQFRNSMQSLGAHALDEHKQRLDNASNSWLLTTVTKLNQQSDDLINKLAAETETRLKSVCNSVFAEMGETLRQRMAGFSDPFTSSINRPAPIVPPGSPEKK